MRARGCGAAAVAAAIGILAVWGTARGEARADSASTQAADSLRAAAPSEFRASPYDTTSALEFRERHAYSLDHFLEMDPGVFVSRRGPIGADADFSRYGFGRGRGRLYLGVIPLNDPQDDRYPLAVFPTTLVGALLGGSADGVFLPERGNIEGVCRVDEPAPPLETPVVAIELSKGTSNLRQRRARFSSIEGPVGLDLEYDELLNDGYQFDARELVGGFGYGGSNSRSIGGNLRGTLRGGVDYAFTFRRFTSVFDGDLTSPDSELRRDGHLAAIKTSTGGVSLSFFERTHKASAPDSATSNDTYGVYASSMFEVGGRADVLLGAGYEDIHSRQTMGNAESRPRLQKGHVGITGRFLPEENTMVTLEAEATHYFDLQTGWGGEGTFAKWFGGRNRILVALGRRYRMPNLGELFQPEHRSRVDPEVVVAGNRDVAEETGLEASASWFIGAGAFTNEIKATALRVDDPIFYEPAESAPGGIVSARNGGREDIALVDERADVRHMFFGFLLDAGGSFSYASGERARFFSGVPEYRATVEAGVGRDLFKHTSAFRVSAEFLRVGARKAGSADPLPAFGVLNVKLAVRLVDAHLYVQWLNVTDEVYETVWPYLETPRTFVYGVEWTLFD
jgi:hypothetical protein